MGSGASRRSRSQTGSKSGTAAAAAAMALRGSDQHLRELLLEKTGEIQRLKAETDR